MRYGPQPTETKIKVEITVTMEQQQTVPVEEENMEPQQASQLSSTQAVRFPIT